MMRAYLIDDPTHWAESAPQTHLDLVSINAAGEDYFIREERLRAIPDWRGRRPCRAVRVCRAGRRCAGTAGERGDAVLTVLPEDSSPMDRGEIAYAARALGVTSLSTLNYALRRLVDEGRAKKTGRGAYARAATTSGDSRA